MNQHRLATHPNQRAELRGVGRMKLNPSNEGCLIILVSRYEAQKEIERPRPTTCCKSLESRSYVSEKEKTEYDSIWKAKVSWNWFEDIKIANFETIEEDSSKGIALPFFKQKT